MHFLYLCIRKEKEMMKEEDKKRESMKELDDTQLEKVTGGIKSTTQSI
jgi:bacteriocin-like protein